MERNIKLLSAFNFFTDFKLHSAVLIIYFANVTGSYALATSLFSAVMVSAALFEIPTGIYSDMIGRKKTALLGAVAATVSAVLYAAGTSYWPLFAGAILEGLSRAWYSGNNEALLFESVSASKSKGSFAHHLGKTSSMFQLALMISAVAGSIIAQWSFAVIMWLSVIPQIICLVLTFFLTDPTRITKQSSNIYTHLSTSLSHLWRNKKLRLLSLSNIIGFGTGESSFQFNAAFIATLWPIWAVGLSRLISFGGAFISFWFSSPIIKKIGAYNILILSNLFTRTVAIIGYGFPTIASPVIVATPSFWYGAYEVSKKTLLQEEYTEEQRATLSSLTSFAGSMFYGVFAIVMGLVADAHGPAKALLMAQVFMLSALAINIRLRNMHYANTRH